MSAFAQTQNTDGVKPWAVYVELGPLCFKIGFIESLRTEIQDGPSR